MNYESTIMKIGLSFGKCIRDIVLGTVDPGDVLVIVSSTHIENRDKLQNMVDVYLGDDRRFGGLDPEKCLNVCQKLWDDGKIFQPREFSGAWISHFSGTWVEMVPSAHDASPEVMDAWVSYRTMLTLGGEIKNDITRNR